ncbi:dipeptidase [Lacipirellula limnantheis]|uniref:Membrane dipeptidase (Peptidase family M19) n=1 Tax=Lacipirellula limnantheis TaxID=2528024 RepID=A0A517U3I4_9BACT|nr:dipeptidase [Lacipirellula limnantheis]QDT75173.1 Membrane dipeptidase (Peptidase family M19) [Lacipirellula limnantheis]
MNSLSKLMERLALVLVVGALASAESPAAEPVSRPPVVLTDEARKLHAETLLIDGHNDLPWELRQQARGQFDKLDVSKAQPTLQTDIPRLRQGGVGAQFWSVWVPGETSKRGAALSTTIEQIELVKAMIARYPETFELALTANDIERIAKTGKIASLIGVEGGYSIEGSIPVLRQLYGMGARYMTLTHSDSLDWADSGTDVPRSGGLSDFGEEVVREMNRLGMMVDISHVSPAAMKAVLKVAKAPVIFSHSSARAVADHPRNVPDDVLKLTAANGGVVMVNFFSAFIVPESAARDVERMAYRREIDKTISDEGEVEQAMKRWDAEHGRGERGTIHTLIDHIDHIVQVAGVEHVGIGSDYDGVSMLPAQLEDVSTYPYITQALLDRGYSHEDIKKINGGNLLRVMRATEQAAEK